jgi:hypothetical protein
MTLTRENVLTAIDNNPKACENALLAMWARQTADEQNARATGHQNGIGFNSTDAELLSSFAEQVEKRRASGRPAGQCLSEKQLLWARKKLQKYGRQLLEIAEEKAAARIERAAEITTPAATPTPERAVMTCPDGCCSVEYDIMPANSRLVIEGNNMRWQTPKEMARAGVNNLRLPADMKAAVMARSVSPFDHIPEYTAAG